LSSFTEQKLIKSCEKDENARNHVLCLALITDHGEEESPVNQVAGENLSVSGATLETNCNLEESQPSGISKTSEKPPEKRHPSYKSCYVGPQERNDGYIDPSLPAIPQHLDDDRFHDLADGSMPGYCRRDTRFDAGNFDDSLPNISNHSSRIDESVDESKPSFARRDRRIDAELAIVSAAGHNHVPVF
jgi:hypothetical protein